MWLTAARGEADNPGNVIKMIADKYSETESSSDSSHANTRLLNRETENCQSLSKLQNVIRKVIRTRVLNARVFYQRK